MVGSFWLHEKMSVVFEGIIEKSEKKRFARGHGAFETSNGGVL